MKNDKIFDCYIDDKCPCCGAFKSSDDSKFSRTSGGKTMALTFNCYECACVYIVGFNRMRDPIESEIITNGLISNKNTRG